MRTIYLILLKSLCCIAFLSLNNCSTYHVYNTGTDKCEKHNGLSYVLPKTVFDLKITVETKKANVSKLCIKGEESDFKTELNKLNFPVDYIVEDNTIHSIKSIELVEVPVPDECERYFVHFKQRNNPFIAKKFSVTQTVEGFMTETHNTSENYVPSYVISAIDGVSNLALSSLGVDTDDEEKINSASKASQTTSSIVAQINKLYCAKQNILLSKNDQLKNIDERKMIESIDKEIKARLGYLVGSKKTTSQTYLLRHEPCAGVREYRFYIDQKGKPTKNGANNSQSLILTIDAKDALISPRIISNAKPKQQGYFYRIPAVCEVVIKDCETNKVYFNKHLSIPQFGTTAHLPNRMGMFGDETKIELDHKTGALINFENNATEIDAESGAGLVESLSDKAANALKKSDELSKEEEYFNELEHKVKVKALELKMDSLMGVSFD